MAGNIETGRGTEDITELAIAVEAIYTLAAVFALPTAAIVQEVCCGIEEFTFWFFYAVVWNTSFADYIETG